MFKKQKPKANQSNLRKRKSEDISGDQTETKIVKKAKNQQRGLVASSAEEKERRDQFKEDEKFSFASSDSAKPAGSSDQLATAELEQKDEKTKTKEEIEASKVDKRGKRVYRGLDAYTKTSEKGRFAGPKRGSSNLRVTCRFDYQPDICKDYKETGYCGYGDSCKFLHDRGDYKSGWELEQEFEAEQKKKREAAMLGKLNVLFGDDPDEYYIESSSEEEEKDGLPFACLICKEPFKNPIVTKCKHYFCENCALEHYKTTPKCFYCKENTSGIFNVANDLIKKLAQKERKDKEKAMWAKKIVKEEAENPEEEEEEEEQNQEGSEEEDEGNNNDSNNDNKGSDN
eukprot:TRINITY_DN2859_c1_g1_i1.p1 TRINITY_DN2859_c1_g1~~TRINITY_DN2859_c1_g1_i1.p1  ORF type:complete len:342 (+),score=109.39 TRINITY_DN2859_c1_g1_i1:21-1046(+)